MINTNIILLIKCNIFLWNFNYIISTYLIILMFVLRQVFIKLVRKCIVFFELINIVKEFQDIFKFVQNQYDL